MGCMMFCAGALGEEWAGPDRVREVSGDAHGGGDGCRPQQAAHREDLQARRARRAGMPASRMCQHGLPQVALGGQLLLSMHLFLAKSAVCLCQDALEALGEEDAACLQEQLKGGAPAKLTAAEGRVFEVTPAMVDISRVQKKVAGRCGAAQGLSGSVVMARDSVAVVRAVSLPVLRFLCTTIDGRRNSGLLS